MLESLEDFKKAEMVVGNVINGVDSPSLMTADSTAVVSTAPDVLTEESTSRKGETDEKVKESVQGEEEKKTEEKEEETKEEKEELAQKKEIASDSHDAQKRIAKLTKKWRSTERELNFKNTKISELESEIASLKAKVPLEGRPEKIDFEDEDEYIEALVAWNVENATRSAKMQVEKAQEETSERSSLDAVYSAVDEILDEGSEKYSDFEALVRDPDLALSTEMLEVVLDSTEPVEVLYYLGQNPDEAIRIAGLTPGRMAKALLKIEEQILLKAEEEKKAKEEEEKAAEAKAAEKVKRKITTAPEPIVPPKSQGIAEKDPLTMTPKEYRAWRESGGTF